MARVEEVVTSGSRVEEAIASESHVAEAAANGSNASSEGASSLSVTRVEEASRMDGVNETQSTLQCRATTGATADPQVGSTHSVGTPTEREDADDDDPEQTKYVDNLYFH